MPNSDASFTIRFIQHTDFAAWLPLWEAYNTFYKRTLPDEVTQTTWSRFLDPAEPMHALVAVHDDRIIGLTHYLFHRNTGMIGDACYLQDLFTVEDARGLGVGRALIEAVHDKAREKGSPRIYWQTHETNATARRLYDKVAVNSGFIVYRKS